MIFLLLSAISPAGGEALPDSSVPLPGTVPSSPQPQKPDALPQMLELTWSAGPHLPLGVQDNRCGIIKNWMISTCGFCSGVDGEWKIDKYIRGFFNDTYYYAVVRPAGIDVCTLG